MTEHPPDRDRAAVYAAEQAAFDGTDLESVVGVQAAAGLIAAVAATSWWPGPPVDGRPARVDARSSSARTSGPAHPATVLRDDAVVIRLAAPQATPATVAHELAHALAGVGRGHDEVFRRAYLDVVRVLTNLDSTDRRAGLHVDQLREAFGRLGLSVGERRWREPAGYGRAIAL